MLLPLKTVDVAASAYKVELVVAAYTVLQE